MDAKEQQRARAGRSGAARSWCRGRRKGWQGGQGAWEPSPEGCCRGRHARQRRNLPRRQPQERNRGRAIGEPAARCAAFPPSWEPICRPRRHRCCCRGGRSSVRRRLPLLDGGCGARPPSDGTAGSPSAARRCFCCCSCCGGSGRDVASGAHPAAHRKRSSSRGASPRASRRAAAAARGPGPRPVRPQPQRRGGDGAAERAAQDPLSLRRSGQDPHDGALIACFRTTTLGVVAPALSYPCSPARLTHPPTRHNHAMTRADRPGVRAPHGAGGGPADARGVLN